MPDTSAFWSYVNREGPPAAFDGTPCWLWCGVRSPKGYGFCAPPRKMRGVFSTPMAHRVSWLIAMGPIPDGVLVLHQCDVRACVRPSHLFLGSDKTNSDDKIEKGRGQWAQGEAQHLAKLTEEAVRIIRAERALTPPTPIRVLAERFGVTTPAVSYAALRKTWKHVE